MLTDLSIFLSHLCFKHVPNYSSIMLISKKMNITFTTEHKTDELISMQKCYKTNNYYDMQKTTPN